MKTDSSSLEVADNNYQESHLICMLIDLIILLWEMYLEDTKKILIRNYLGMQNLEISCKSNDKETDKKSFIIYK